MSLTPAAPGEYEVVVHDGRRSAWTTRARAAARGARLRLGHLRRWLGTPQGRRTAIRAAKAVAAAVAVVGGVLVVRRWTASVRDAAAAVAGGYRSVTGALMAATRAARLVSPLRWFSALLRWSMAGNYRRYRSCPECHTRIRSDARVCYRCGHRSDPGGIVSTRGAPTGSLLWIWRVLSWRLYRRCPDCRRLVHADATACRSCGFRPLN